MKISTSTFAAVAYAILSASGLRAVPHVSPFPDVDCLFRVNLNRDVL